MTTSRIDRAQSAMIKSTHCSTCKHRDNCDYQALMLSWRYLGTRCNLWEKWDATTAN